jgi:hypothetical protein
MNWCNEVKGYQENVHITAAIMQTQKTHYAKRNYPSIVQTFFYANAQRLAVIKAAKPATAVRKPISTFIPRMAAPLVGVVLVSELVEDAAPVVAVAPLVTEEKDMVPVLVCVEEVVEDVVLELMLNWLD